MSAESKQPAASLRLAMDYGWVLGPRRLGDSEVRQERVFSRRFTSSVARGNESRQRVGQRTDVGCGERHSSDKSKDDVGGAIGIILVGEGVS